LNRLYLEGFPSDVQQQIRTRMMIKFPDHHPEDPYPIKDVRAAACFLLPGNSSVVPLPTSAQAQGPLPSPRRPPFTNSPQVAQLSSKNTTRVEAVHIPRKDACFAVARSITSVAVATKLRTSKLANVR